MKHPEFPDGTEIDIDGVGTVKNGESITVTQEMQDAWSAQNDGLDLKKSLAQNGAVDFNGKNKLADGAKDLNEVDPEVQKMREAADIRDVTVGGEK
jgi:hypothetical protein